MNHAVVVKVPNPNQLMGGNATRFGGKLCTVVSLVFCLFRGNFFAAWIFVNLWLLIPPNCPLPNPTPRGTSDIVTTMMAEEQEADEFFVYVGGDQFVPDDVRRVRIDVSVTIIASRAFEHRRSLIYVEFHDGIDIIEKHAFNGCYSLRNAKLLGVKIIGERAFNNCIGLRQAEFGDKLKTIQRCAFQNCRSLRSITMPSVKLIGYRAFASCVQLTDVEFGEGLQAVGQKAFEACPSLQLVAIPLKSDMIGIEVFYNCPQLAAVALVGGVHNTVASLHLESWRNEMKCEINRINQVLPTMIRGMTAEIQQWIRSVIRLLDQYKVEHKAMLKEATALLELALWKANLDNNEGGVREMEGVRTTRGRRKRARKEICVTSGASIVIKNVLPFLELK